MLLSRQPIYFNIAGAHGVPYSSEQSLMISSYLDLMRS